MEATAWHWPLPAMPTVLLQSCLHRATQPLYWGQPCRRPNPRQKSRRHLHVKIRERTGFSDIRFCGSACVSLQVSSLSKDIPQSIEDMSTSRFQTARILRWRSAPFDKMPRSGCEARPGFQAVFAASCCISDLEHGSLAMGPDSGTDTPEVDERGMWVSFESCSSWRATLDELRREQSRKPKFGFSLAKRETMPMVSEFRSIRCNENCTLRL